MGYDILKLEEIKSKIYTIRGVQVMLDRDLADLYGIETRVLKQAVKRNIKRFPKDFMIILTESEIEDMVSQAVIPSKKYFGGAKPFAFTEQGVAMLSSILNSDKAISINIHIMRAFVSMRKFINQNAEIFHRLDRIEYKQIEYDKKFEAVFKALENREGLKKQGIFFDGQIFDAYKFVSDLIRSAKESIVLIDNYIDDSVLMLFTKREKNVKAVIYTKKITKQLELDIKKHNEQYSPITIEEISNVHDRFLIIDNKDVYHIGASLKDLGKKLFAFSKLDREGFKIFEKLGGK